MFDAKAVGVVVECADESEASIWEDDADQEDAEPRRRKSPTSRPLRLSEDEILDRLDELQDAVHLPSEVWDFLAFHLCPDGLAERPMPNEPTEALPGTEEKLRVLARRLAAGQSLFHPNDAKPEDNDRVCILAARLRNGVAQRVADLPVARQEAGGFRVLDEERPDVEEPAVGQVGRPVALDLHDRKPLARLQTTAIAAVRAAALELRAIPSAATLRERLRVGLELLGLAEVGTITVKEALQVVGLASLSGEGADDGIQDRDRDR